MTVYTLIEVYYDGEHVFYGLVDIYKEKQSAIDAAVRLLTNHYDEKSPEKCLVEGRGQSTTVYFEDEGTVLYWIEPRELK